jgi:hypothetical protein
MPRSFAVGLFFVAATAIAQAPPVITSVDVVVTRSPYFDMNLVITGSNFPNNSEVYIDSNRVGVLSSSPTVIRCNAAAGTGKNHVVAIAVDGQQVTNSMQFSYPPPTIFRLPSLPSSVPYQLAYSFPGNTFTFRGTGFGDLRNKPTVTVGEIVCPVTWVSPIEISCTLPPGRGPVPVRVVVGEQSSNENVTVNLRPRIDSISPQNGSTAGGTSMTINGTGFGTSGAVSVAGVPCPSTGWSDTRVVCTVPAGQGRSQSVVVDNSNTTNFTYDAPAVGNVYPASGPWKGGIAITLRGINFGTSATVTIGGQPCAVSGQSQAIIQCTLPPSNAVMGGAVPVIVNVSNQQSAPASFTYLAP